MFFRTVYSNILFLGLLSTQAVGQAPYESVDSLTSASEELLDLEALLLSNQTLGDSLLDSLVGTASLDIPDSLDWQPSRNELLVDNYYQSVDTLSTGYGVRHQTAATFTRRQEILGIGIRIGGRFYLNDGRPDWGRSGLTFAFDRSNYLRQLQRAGNTDLEQAMLDRLSRYDPELLLARKEEFFRRYLKLTQTPAYRDLYTEARHTADSLRGYAADEFDARSKALLAFYERCNQLSSYYDRVLDELQNTAGDPRRRGERRLDSLRQLVAIDPESMLIEQLRKSATLTELQRLALSARRFAVGNVRLPTDGMGSIGLPIRGIDFAYERNGLGVEVQFGHRILSQRFTPRDGIVFHDLNRRARFARLGMGYHGGRHDYTLALTDAVERDTSPDLSRRNQVVTLGGRTEVAEILSVTTELSYARTAASREQAAVDAGDLSWQVGLQLNPVERLRIEVAAFRTGVDYQSFANPYLYTDYQGIETEITATRLVNIFDASFSLAGGIGTTEQTRENFRWRAQGRVRTQISPSSSLLLLFSPNVYRYKVTGREGLSESSIYQFSYQYAPSSGASAHLGVTNLNQGLAWADTSTVSRNVVASGQGSLPLGRICSVQTQFQHAFGTGYGDGEPALPFNYGVGISFSGQRHRVSVGVDYGRFSMNRTATWGGSIDYQANLASWAVLRLNAYLRPLETVDAGTGLTRIDHQTYSQQSWLANF